MVAMMQVMNLVPCLLFFSVCLPLDLVCLRRGRMRGEGNASTQICMLLNRWHAGNPHGNLFNVKLCPCFQPVVWIWVIFHVSSVEIDLL